jgi:hypothetical protein
VSQYDWQAYVAQVPEVQLSDRQSPSSLQALPFGCGFTHCLAMVAQLSPLSHSTRSSSVGSHAPPAWCGAEQVLVESQNAGAAQESKLVHGRPGACCVSQTFDGLQNSDGRHTADAHDWPLPASAMQPDDEQYWVAVQTVVGLLQVNTALNSTVHTGLAWLVPWQPHTAMPPDTGVQSML